MRYVAFLRAINVGKHNRIRMVGLREACAAAGLADVTTYLQTGNLAFDSALAAEEVALLLEATLVGMGCRGADAIVLPHKELVELLAMQPFTAHEGDGYRRMVTLTRQALPEGAMETLAARGVTALAVHPRAIFTAFEVGGATPPDLNGLLERVFKTRSTTRFWQVVEAMI